jgi:hypothetical protein
MTVEQIYSHVLVQDGEIPIKSGVTQHQNFREIPSSKQPGHDGTGNYPPLPVVYPLAVPVRKRSTWKVPLKHLAPWNNLSHSYSDEGIIIGPVDASEVMVEMTYQVVHGVYGPRHDDKPTGHSVAVQGLECLLVSQQMYEEARQMFYSKNKFTAGDHTAFAYFLQDRPEACRSYVRSVGMHFDERAWDESFESGTSYCEDFEKLCRVLSGPSMGIRDLELTVFNQVVEPCWTGRVTLASCLRTEKRDPKPPFLQDSINKGR